MTALRLATRSSDLALAQSRAVAARIESELGVAVELLPMKSTGDRLQDVSLAKVGGKGLFVKELEEALLEGRADLAVHSAKDLPARVPDGLELIAFPERADPRDALIGRERGDSVAGLRRGARIGTGSVRRIALLRAARPDLEIVPLRGNVPTRLRKLVDEDLDAVILACAGLERLGLADRIDERIESELMLPAVAQGTLAIETRAGDPATRGIAALGCPRATATAAAERAFLTELAGDCSVPLAAFAEPVAGDQLRFRALLASSDGTRILRRESQLPTAQAADAGIAAATSILADGGAELLAALRAEAEA